METASAQIIADAEFDYRPSQCTRSYQMVVVRQEIDVTNGQQLLFSKDKYFFYISNETADETRLRRAN